MKTKNMMIRDFYNLIDNCGMNSLKKTTLPLDYTKKAYHYNIFNCNIDEQLKSIYTMTTGNNFRYFVVIMSMITMVMITDAYEYLRTKEKIEGLSVDEQILFYKIITGIMHNDFRYILQDSASLEYCTVVMEKYMEESALRKIELAKSLSKDDIDFLSKFNIYFEEEYTHYNIEITEEFLLKHLNIWIKKSGFEEGINTIAKFILDLYNLQNEECINIASIIVPNEEKRNSFVEELNNKDMNTISAFIATFYESHKKDNRELK